MGAVNITGISVEVNLCPRRAVTTTDSESETTTSQPEAVLPSPVIRPEPLVPAEPETDAESATPYLDKEPLLPAEPETESDSASDTSLKLIRPLYGSSISASQWLDSRKRVLFRARWNRLRLFARLVGQVKVGARNQLRLAIGQLTRRTKANKKAGIVDPAASRLLGQTINWVERHR